VRALDGGAMLAALLAQAAPLAIEDGVLVVSYPHSAAFSKRKVESQANRERITEALRQVSGHRLGVRFELGDQDLPAEGATEPTLSEDELIDRIKEMFDAEDVLEEQPEPERENTEPASPDA
jgi:hypothetical protein